MIFALLAAMMLAIAHQTAAPEAGYVSHAIYTTRSGAEVFYRDVEIRAIKEMPKEFAGTSE